ncbi:MAG: mannan-binding protein [Brasilonema sp.]
MKLPIQAQPVVRNDRTVGTSVVSGITPSVDVPAGPIWNNDDARVKCPAVCTAVGRTWSGAWVTTVWGQMSVCGCN